MIMQGMGELVLLEQSTSFFQLRRYTVGLSEP
jgi:hypothetical protein